SRTIGHRSKNGELTPMFGAEEAELLGIARGMALAESGVIELISDFLNLEEEWQRVRNMAIASGRPVSVSIIQIDGFPERWRQILQCIERARADGLPISGQVSSRPTGVLMSLSSSLHPFMNHPSYREVAELPMDQRIVALRDRERRQRLF